MSILMIALIKTFIRGKKEGSNQKDYEFNRHNRRYFLLNWFKNLATWIENLDVYDISKSNLMPEELNNLADFANDTMSDMSTFLIKNKPE